MNNWTLEVGDLFKTVGLKTAGLVEMNENTYDFDPKNPKDSWLYPVLLGFLKLKRQGFKPESFVTIGTGSGIDSIGAYEIFRPKEIYQADVHPNVPDVADANTKKLIGRQVNIQTFLGDLCEPLISRGIKADFVYGNLPNVPSEELVWGGKVSASKFMARDVENCPEIFQKWLLTLQYLFLKQAKQVVKPGGVVVDALGARVPDGILQKLFTENGYQVTELAGVYKAQSEPEDVLEGYVKAEKEFGVEVEFDFYDHEKALPVWREKLENQKLSSQKIKQALQPFGISAGQAWQDFQKHGKTPGHVCSILAGKL